MSGRVGLITKASIAKLTAWESQIKAKKSFRLVCHFKTWSRTGQDIDIFLLYKVQYCFAAH